MGQALVITLHFTTKIISFPIVFLMKVGKDLFQILKKLTNTKKKITFTFVSKKGIVRRFKSDYYTQGNLKIISEMFKKFLEISNNYENWNEYDLKNENNGKQHAL